MGKGFSKEQNVACVMLLMWFILGIITMLFFRFGVVLDRGKPILIGLAINGIVLWRMKRLMSMLDVSLIGSLAGLTVGSATMMLTTNVFFQHTPNRLIFVLKWGAIAAICIYFFVVRFRKLGEDIEAFQPTESTFESTQLPDGFESWSELERLRYMEVQFSEPLFEPEVPKVRGMLTSSLGLVFIGAGIVMYVIPLKSQHLALPLVAIGILSASLPLIERFGQFLGRKIVGEKYSAIFSEVEESRSLFAQSIRDRIAELEAQPGRDDTGA